MGQRASTKVLEMAEWFLLETRTGKYIASYRMKVLDVANVNFPLESGFNKRAKNGFKFGQCL